jgi:serine/threonine protein kinase
MAFAQIYLQRLLEASSLFEHRAVLNVFVLATVDEGRWLVPQQHGVTGRQLAETITLLCRAIFPRFEKRAVLPVRTLSLPGANTDVFVGFIKEEEKLVCVKQHLHPDGEFIIPLHVLMEVAAACRIRLEPELHTCRHLPKTFSIVVEENKTTIISEYFPLCYLSLFRGVTPLYPLWATHAEQLVSTIKLLHSHHIVHRDVKLQNVCLRENGRTTLVLIDFDSCSIMSDLRSVFSTMYPVGSTRERAIEIDGSSREYLPHLSDMWSTGVTLLDMFFGMNDNNNSQKKMSLLSQELQQPRLLPHMSVLAKRCFRRFDLESRKFLAHMLHHDPSSRSLMFFQTEK